MKKFNLLRKSERKSVGTTLALTVGSPSAHRRYSALKHLTFMLLFLLGSLNVWGASPETFDFSSGVYSGANATGIITWQGTSCTIVQSKGENTSNNVNSSYVGTNLRWYANHYVTFTPKSGITITKVVLTGKSGKTGQTMTKTSDSGAASITTTAATYVTEITGSWTSSSVLQIKMGTQFQLNSVVITYSTGGGSDPSLSLDPSSLDLAATGNAQQSITLTASNFSGSVNNVECAFFSAATCQPSEAIAQPEWITSLSDNNSNQVSFNVEDNSEGARNIWMKVTASDGSGSASAILPISQAKFVAPATLPFEYDGNGTGDLPNGLEVSGTGTYGSSPAIKFDGTGDYAIIHFSDAPGKLTYDIKGNTFSGGTFTVQESEDGETYTDVAIHTELGATESEEYDLNSASRYVKFIYTNKSNGNVALGNIAISAYDPSEPCATPTISPAGGSYDAAQSVTITCATEGATIYYTTDGSNPTTSSSVYSSAINVSSDMTIKAIAAKTGYANSNVASATYVMDLPYANIKAFIDGESAKAAANRKLESVTLSNAIISGKSGTTLYIQDETAGIMIYGLAAGDVPAKSDANHSISGTIKAKYSVFSNQHEMVKQDNTHPMDLSGVTVSADPVSRPDISSYATLEAAYAAKPMMLVKLTDVRYDGTQYEFSGNKIYNTFGALTNKTMPETTVDCDITGVVINYNGTLELLPVFASDIVADADAAAPTFTPAGGATEGEAVQVDLNSYVSIAPADANHSVDITSAQITTTDPMSVTAVSSRDFYRNTSVTKWYYGNSASASYDINGQGSTAQGTIVAKVNDEIAASAKENDEVHVFITPNTHFHFATILVNDGAITTTEVSEGAEYSFEMPDEAVTIAVTWNEDAKVNVQFAKGKEAATGDVPSTMSNKYENDVITLPANPFTLTSWKFKGWKHSLTDAIHQPGSYTITAADVAEDAITFAAEWEAMPDFAGGDWMLVTDVAELTEGSYVIIAAADYDKAMKGYVSGNNCGSEDATKEGNLLSYNSNFAIYEIGENVISETTYKTFQNVASENYLFCNTGSTNTLKEQTTINASASWSVEISTAELTLGEAAITNQNASTRSIRYNSSGMFATYTSSGQTPIVLYKYHVPSLKLTYDKNAGDDVVTGMPSMGIADGDKKVTISDATPLREGYLFDGWKDADEHVYEAGVEYTLTADLTIYAQWQTATAHSLSYDKDGGEGDVPDATNYYPNVNVTLANAVTKTGYIFAGWEYDGNIYAAGTSFTMPNVEVVMKAKYAQGAVYTITSRESVSEQGAPEGSSATFYNTYGNDKCQLTSDNSMTLTLSGYDLYTIKAITLRMKSNASKGYGTLSVTIGGNAVSFTTNKWYDGGHHTDSYEDIQVSLTPTRVMPGKNVVIEIEASQNSLYCQSFAIEYELVLDELRGGLTEGKWGTYCPDKEVKHPAGASFYTLTYMELNPDGSPYKFFFDEIAENASLAAGKPYLFIAEGDAIMGVKVGDAADAGDHANNGFVGYLGAGKHITSDYNTYTAGATNYYGLQNNIFKLIYSTSSTENILNERAYVEISPSRQPSTTQVSMPAPGRRRLSVGADAPQIATGLEDGELMNDGMVKKVLINGELFIIRGEQMYDATGRIVK